ncbi:non-ribosomal peptide synthetase [Microbacterium enclense]|uniref:non-ribosomal peptide synthetase n=1 Tax=Microbacterium enclense TaxID=993073 RepID=UPI003F8014B5
MTSPFVARAIAAETCFDRLVSLVSLTAPHRAAVRDADCVLTYGELELAAATIARALTAAEIGPGDRVAILLDRSADDIVALLGVLKIGAAFVPVNREDPPSRIEFILRDAEVRALIASEQARIPGWASTLAVIRGKSADGAASSAPLVSRSRQEEVAYILYTSGSTGSPKGVIVEHRNLSSYGGALLERLDIHDPLRFALTQPLSVDSSLTAIFVALALGGELLVLPSRDVLDPERIADWNRRWPIDAMKIAPSHLRALQRSDAFTRMIPSRFLVIGGEASEWRWIRTLQQEFPHCRVVGHYGPTEATVGVFTFDVRRNLNGHWSTTPIGRPLENTRFRVIDDHGEDVPDGAAGELILSGPGVARGYNGQEELTRQAFSGQWPSRYYRTGDIVRVTPSGEVAFEGRTDDQVKIRGNRVDLADIEVAIAQHPSVDQVICAVEHGTTGPSKIVAFVTTAESGLGFETLSAHVDRVLPTSMHPARFHVMSAFPATAHGKVDRNELWNSPPLASIPRGKQSVDRLGGTIAQITAIWCTLLHHDSLSADARFFDVGGHSLLLVDLQHEIEKTTGRRVDLLALLDNATIRKQAALVDAPEGAEHQIQVPSTRQGRRR